MKSDVLRTDEVERLRMLNSLALHRPGAPDPALLSIVRLARRATGCAFAGISIVDAYRQWFAATDGATLPDSSREQSVCARAILTEAGLVSSDVHKDPRLTPDGPQSIAAGITFYAGMPIRVGGFAIGALCVIDPAARDFNDAARGNLNELAALCGALLDARRPAPAQRRLDASSARLAAVLQAIPISGSCSMPKGAISNAATNRTRRSRGRTTTFEAVRSVKACRRRTHKGVCMRFATRSRPARCSGWSTNSPAAMA